MPPSVKFVHYILEGDLGRSSKKMPKSAIPRRAHREVMAPCEAIESPVSAGFLKVAASGSTDPRPGLLGGQRDSPRSVPKPAIASARSGSVVSAMLSQSSNKSKSAVRITPSSILLKSEARTGTCNGPTQDPTNELEDSPVAGSRVRETNPRAGAARPEIRETNPAAPRSACRNSRNEPRCPRNLTDRQTLVNRRTQLNRLEGTDRSNSQFRLDPHPEHGAQSLETRSKPLAARRPIPGHSGLASPTGPGSSSQDTSRPAWSAMLAMGTEPVVSI
jgi:hypothetical protein